MLTIGAYIQGMGEDAVWLRRVLGARDATTGWPTVTWMVGGCFDCDCFDPTCFLCGGTIKIMVDRMSTIPRDTPQGRVVETRAQMYTMAAIHLKDQIVYAGHYWEVEDANFKHLHLSKLGYYDCTLIRLGES